MESPAFSLCLLTLLAFVGCRHVPEKRIPANKNTYSSTKDTLYLPFDTARVLALYDIPTKVDQINLLKDETIAGLKPGWDTLEVEYQMIACDCPNWYDVTQMPDEPSSEMSPAYGYYIEPASPKLTLFPGFWRCRVRLIGKHYKKDGWPENRDFTDPNPPPGNVFRYYAYEIVLPAVIWGPEYHTGKRQIPSDPEEYITPTLLTIKKK